LSQTAAPGERVLPTTDTMDGAQPPPRARCSSLLFSSKQMRYMTSRMGQPREFRNKVQEPGTGESASLRGSPMAVGLLVGRAHQRGNRLHQGQSAKTRGKNDQADTRRQHEIIPSRREYTLRWRGCQDRALLHHKRWRAYNQVKSHVRRPVARLSACSGVLLVPS
jgi:hypothetical protein